MFTVKATYRNETRRFTFPDAVLFPTYDQLYHQLHRLFPIGRSCYLSRLVFSPDASRPGRILVGKEVHSAEDYDSYIAPLRRRWPNPLLRFTIFDETAPQKTPTVTSEKLSLYGTPTLPSLDVTPNLPSPAPRHCYASPLNSPSLAHPYSPPTPFVCVLPPPPPPPPPPLPFFPPVMFSPTPDRSQSIHGRGTARTPLCCPFTRGKADIEILLSSFKEDLERILCRTFGSSYMEQQSTEEQPCGVSGPNVIPPPRETPASARPEAARWCFVCRTSFDGVWYGCVKCPWHAVCPSCFSKSHSAHTLSFGPSHLVEQRSTDRPSQVSVQTAGETKPRHDLLENSELPSLASSNLAGESHPVHHGVICDECDKTLVGVRHKCLDCPDYDLCTACVESGATERHNPFHEFFDIETPGRVHVHVVQGDGWNNFLGNGQSVSSSDHAQVRQSPVVASTDSPVRHAASCNLCDSGIVGERYKCVVCPDYDTCSSCFRITTEQHPNHGFVKVIKPEDLMMRDSISLRQVAHPAICDSCRKSIRGTRYKCMHPGCPDFDLCSDCEALPIPVHPLNHPMLKLRTPGIAIPTIHRIGQMASDEPSSQKRLSVSDESVPLLPPSPPQTTVKSPEIVAASGRVADTAEDQALPVEEFLSPSGSPVHAEAPAACIAVAQSQIVEPPWPKSPRLTPPPLDIHYQLWPSANQEIVHLNAVQGPKAEDAAVNVIENDVMEPVSREPLVADAPISVISVTSKRSRSASPVSCTQSIVSDYITPPPMSSGVQEPYRAAQQLLGNKQETVMTSAPQQNPLDSALVGDTNVPDGQIFPSGAEFVKGWHMFNSGRLPWPPNTEIQFVAGEMFAPEPSAALRAKVGFAHPGQALDIWTGDLKAPDVPGRYVGYWRLNDGRGNFFGNVVRIDLTVVDHHSVQASEHSLAASLVVMPNGHATNSTDANDELRNALQHSPPSDTAMDEIGEPESDASSVSLVSIPTSDGEEAEWQDTRTHSEPLEYVVLYDSNSEA